jgi:hypothetical protein
MDTVTRADFAVSVRVARDAVCDRVGPVYSSATDLIHGALYVVHRRLEGLDITAFLPRAKDEAYRAYECADYSERVRFLAIAARYLVLAVEADMRGERKHAEQCVLQAATYARESDQH